MRPENLSTPAGDTGAEGATSAAEGTTPGTPIPVPPQGKKGKGGRGHTAASQYFLQQQQRERAIQLSQQKVSHTIYIKRFTSILFKNTSNRRIKHVAQNNGTAL